MTSATMDIGQLDLNAINDQLTAADPTQIIRWAADRFGGQLVMSSSFGAQAAVTLHMAQQVVPQIPVIFVDTGYLFPETYLFVDQLTERLRLNLTVYQSQVSPARDEALHGKQWEQGPEGLAQYNQRRKIEPMQRALRELHAAAWLAGLRNEQTQHRSGLRVVEPQDGVYKIHPILRWTSKDVYDYLKKHDLPFHPLYEKGYRSIGDTHTTVPITAEMHERAGRFHGLKQECGLHLPATAEEDQSRECSGL